MPRTLSGQEREKRLHRGLREGVSLYNAGRFFKAHEVLEDVWLEEDGDDKAFLQGIIKIAAAFHHYGKGTYRGMRNLLQAGSQMLAPYSPTYRGVELANFLSQIERWVPWAAQLVEGEEPDLSEPIPSLVYRPPPSSAPPEEVR